MAGSSLQYRRQLRALEAKRDKLLEAQDRHKLELAKVRAELKSTRARGAK